MENLASKCPISRFIYDGNSTFKSQPPLFIPLQTLIKGDTLIHQISSASILAKYAKDLECQEIHTLYPQYDFLSHSGYCTAKHKELISTLGYTPFHRKSFIIYEISLALRTENIIINLNLYHGQKKSLYFWKWPS